jgi:hypothetical protein
LKKQAADSSGTDVLRRLSAWPPRSTEGLPIPLCSGLRFGPFRHLLFCSPALPAFEVHPLPISPPHGVFIDLMTSSLRSRANTVANALVASASSTVDAGPVSFCPSPTPAFHFSGLSFHTYTSIAAASTVPSVRYRTFPNFLDERALFSRGVRIPADPRVLGIDLLPSRRAIRH